MLLPERFSCSITFLSFSKFLFGIPCTFTFVFLPSISVLEILLFNFQRSCARPPRKLPPFRGELFYFTISRPFCQEVFLIFFGFLKKRSRATRSPLFSLSTRFFRQKNTLLHRKDQFLTLFWIIIAQKSCTFRFEYDIIEKSVSVR